MTKEKGIDLFKAGIELGKEIAMREFELPKTPWIPVKEKLPPECEEVIITWVNLCPPSYLEDIKGRPFTGAGIYCRGRWFWYSATCKDYCEEYGFSQVDEMDEEIKVIAWKHFPEPYMEKKENANNRTED